MKMNKSTHTHAQALQFNSFQINNQGVKARIVRSRDLPFCRTIFFFHSRISVVIRTRAWRD